MPNVILPAKDVADAARRVLAEMEERAKRPANFPNSVPTEMRKTDPHPDKLNVIVEAADWLANMNVPNPQIGLTLDEARMLYGAR